MKREKIVQLLKSPNKDDVILGTYMAYTQLGRRWCRDNFIISDNGDFPYPCKLNILLEFDDCNIFLGTHYIEYLNVKGVRHTAGAEKINFKTNDTNKELPKSIPEV